MKLLTLMLSLAVGAGVAQAQVKSTRVLAQGQFFCPSTTAGQILTYHASRMSYLIGVTSAPVFIAFGSGAVSLSTQNAVAFSSLTYISDSFPSINVQDAWCQAQGVNGSTVTVYEFGQ